MSQEMVMAGMVRRDDAFRMEGSFWAMLQEVVEKGISDLATGFDRVSFDRLDPRVEGGLDGGFALARGLAQAWRTDGSRAAVPVVVLAGTTGGGLLKIHQVAMDAWPAFADLHFLGDGHVAILPTGSQARRMRGEGRPAALEAILGVQHGPDELKGDFTLTIGLTQADPFLARAAAQAGVEGHGAVVLWLYEPASGPVDIHDAGGPIRNCWHFAQAAVAGMSHSFLTPSYAKLGQEERVDPWYHQGTRDEVQRQLVERAQREGQTVSHRDVLNALAETSPLRKVLPHHLTRFFPECERIFWCLPSDEASREAILPGIDPERWDLASPMERFNLLSRMKVAQSR